MMVLCVIPFVKFSSCESHSTPKFILVVRDRFGELLLVTINVYVLNSLPNMFSEFSNG